MKNNTEKNNHYNDKYFEWQKKSGVLEAKIDRWKFKQYIDKDDIVLDFGCGGGFILDTIICKSKYGVEINEYAVKSARSKGIEVLSSVSDLPAGLKFNKIISNHALEHVDNPLEVLKLLKEKLDKKGRIVFYLPFDSLRIGGQYDSKDINQHLYTWNRQLAGNLFNKAGFKVKSVTIIHHAWPPKSNILSKLLPKSIFSVSCFLWSYIIDLKQIKIIAEV